MAAKIVVHMGSSFPQHFGFEHSVNNLPAIYIYVYIYIYVCTCLTSY
jgi:hypothetical protein